MCTSLPKTISDAIAIAQRLLSFLPANNTEDPPHHLAAPVELYEDAGMDDLAQSDPSEPMDMHGIIGRLVDDGDFLEVHALFAQNLIVGFARIEGVVVGIIANNPMAEGRRPGHRLLRQGGAVHPLLQ